MKYKHALFLNPYIENTATSVMRLFPPTGLEYVATSAEGLVDKITFLDLRYETDLCDTGKLVDFIRKHPRLPDKMAKAGLERPRKRCSI